MTITIGMTFSTSRIEAFSDGVIAIIITLMILEIKMPHIESGASSAKVWHALSGVVPYFISYILSFIVIGIMWVNHHYLFHLVKHSDTKLLWLNINLLFWMSVIPLPTGFIGEHYLLREASMFYGFVLGMCGLGFYFLRRHANIIMKDFVTTEAKEKINRKNLISSSLYFSSVAFAFISVYISFFIFILIPVMYFIPEKAEK